MGLVGLAAIVVLCCILRARKNRKLFGSSPAYAGLKASTGNSSLSSNGHTITLVTDGSGGTLRPFGLNATLRQGPDGLLYVAPGLGDEKRPLPSLPSWNAFHFPPPPPPDATDSSEYAEPAEFRQSTATLPLLPNGPSYALPSKPLPPPRTTLTSPRSPHRRRPNPRTPTSPTASKRAKSDKVVVEVPKEMHRFEARKKVAAITPLPSSLLFPAAA